MWVLYALFTLTVLRLDGTAHSHALREGCNGEHVLVNKYILFRGLLRNGDCGCRKSRSLECGQGYRENKVCD